MSTSIAQEKTGIVVLISGNGSNLQAIIDAMETSGLPVAIRAVISNRSSAYGLQRAARANIHTQTIDDRDYPNRASYETVLQTAIDSYAPDLIVLAGYMRILSPGFVSHYEGRMMNIHPSLLPHFRGLHTHRRALEARVSEHGASVHFVTKELDGGPLIVQARVPVLPDDDADRLAKRVLAMEHRIYPLAIRWYAEGRLRMRDGQPCLDDKLLSQAVDYKPE